MNVFVLDTDRRPLDPCPPARARYLLKKGRAAVFRRDPFTIILNDRLVEDSIVHEHRIKVDPGSKTTGVAIVQSCGGKGSLPPHASPSRSETTGKVVAAAEIEHRGQAVKASLADRKTLRRNRRARKTRYRRPRSKAEAKNQETQKKAKGWLPPSLESRLANVLTWVARLCRLCPITAVSQELIRFDLQKLENPETSGIEYQQGTLAGYELREYLLEKHKRTCAYCDKTDVPLQIEHIVPKSRGGTDRVSNLTLACVPCNRRKGNRPVEVFLQKDPDRLAKVKRDAQAPLKDATAVNATRWELYRRLQATGLPVETGSGGRTKFNRTTRDLPKAHWLDAACVGASTPETLLVEGVRPLLVKACGHGKRQRQNLDKYGSPRGEPARRPKTSFGFQTGDIVRAVIPNGKHRGTHTGRIAIRHRPSFRMGAIDVHPDRLAVVYRADGYAYSLGETFPVRGSHAIPPSPEGDGPLANFLWPVVDVPLPRRPAAGARMVSPARAASRRLPIPRIP
jgi:5-methylcytosine-specific restriction endonuclease McrA